MKRLISLIAVLALCLAADMCQAGGPVVRRGFLFPGAAIRQQARANELAFLRAQQIRNAQIRSFNFGVPVYSYGVPVRNFGVPVPVPVPVPTAPAGTCQSYTTDRREPL